MRYIKEHRFYNYFIIVPPVYEEDSCESHDFSGDGGGGFIVETREREGGGALIDERR